MKIERYYEPIAHLVVKDFFKLEERKLLLNCLKGLDEYFRPGVVVDKKSIDVNYDKKNVLEFHAYQNKHLEEAKSLIDVVERNIWSMEMRQAYKQTKDSMFQYYFTADYSQIVVKKYSKDCHYTWHRDNYKSITANIWLSEDLVEGGNFMMRSETDEEKEIEFADNVCIFFPSESIHKVTPITNNCTRYAIQYFTERVNTL